MGMTTKEFAETIFGMDVDELEKREVFIKFIVAQGRVIFDPEFFIRFEKVHGEGSLNHEDIANANRIPRHLVEGGAMAAVSFDQVRITGKSRDFGGVDGRIEIVKRFFESYFNCPVSWDRF
jgi:hypothetical protein